MAGYIKKAAQTAKIQGAAKKVFSGRAQAVYKPLPKRSKSVTKYPEVARAMGAEGPKKSSPRPGGVGKAGGKGTPANKRKK